MGRLSDAAIDAVLDGAFGSGHTSFFPASYDLALSTTQPLNDGTNVTEPVGSSYAAVAVDNDDAHFPPASMRRQANGLDITFPQPTGPWGVIGWFVFYVTGAAHDLAHFIAWGALAVARSIDDTSDPPVFLAGALVINGPGS